MPCTTPFWTFAVREKRDLLALRQKARQIAHLLHFPPLEEACITAGVFAVAAQARETLGECDVCFQIDSQSLSVCARCRAETPAPPKLGDDSRPLMKLTKPLPEAARDFSSEDLGWLIARINDHTPADLYGELCKQNQEILLLLHLMQHPDAQLSSKPPSAA